MSEDGPTSGAVGAAGEARPTSGAVGAAGEAGPTSGAREDDTSRRIRLLGWALVVVAVALRVNNALRYRTRMGFDAVQNVEYVQRLLSDWSLPAPDAGWATSHPPLFYYAAAAIGRALALFDAAPALVWVVPLCSSAAGVATAWATHRLVRHAWPDQPARAWLASLLVLYAPVHVYMSAMFSEEILASSLASFAIVAGALFAAEPVRGEGLRSPWVRAAGIGLLVGLAASTKLSGVLVAGALLLAWGASAWREGEMRRVLAPIAAFCLAVAAVGGGYYLRNLLLHGYVYPHGLAIHSVMHEMPPGERGVLDYVYVPLATWTDPQLLNPGLLRSVWGSTFATLWFDGHRHFLPSSVSASRAGSLLLALALVPTAGFVQGVVRGARRWRREPRGVDGPLLALLLLTVAGYVAFTARNPYFATLKGSYMLGAVVPFAFYASDGLMCWIGRGGWPARLTLLALAMLAVGVVVVFTIGLVFTKLDATGLPWRAAA